MLDHVDSDAWIDIKDVRMQYYDRVEEWKYISLSASAVREHVTLSLQVVKDVENGPVEEGFCQSQWKRGD